MTTQQPRVRRRPQIGLLAVQGAAILVGSVLLITGVLGFVPGITSNLDQMQLAGPQSEALLFGVFETSILHNLVHVIVGLLGLAMASTFWRSRAYLLTGGAVFLGFWVYGLLIDHNSQINVLPLNSADTWLYLGLGAVMVVLGLTLAGCKVPTGARGEVLVDPDDQH
ncbi:DUF4383 domain-containing protein [Mycolicibacterium tokaiense]|uniref:DUF4383 domain-containing protein n=1 Tax=Mycolicibacterium tokaiense TaxID=39695 RepID=A0A378TIH2_9MYCO|nr:DUF4383 domain-containing protein [Mycolicibacterium tokaiense]BBY84881.1 membrane protein [Mycolicibacterium tokaiense]STZ60612.1 Uncharacterised protein [Mycolicibacterium tokaiense]